MPREQFTEWVKDMIGRAGGLRAAGRAAGINHATMLNVSRGNDVDLATLEKLATWANVPLSVVLDKYAGAVPRDHRVEFEMGRLFTQYPDLRKTMEAALEHLDDADLRDVINFIQFKAAQHGS
jgi:hypothetical protein